MYVTPVDCPSRQLSIAGLRNEKFAQEAPLLNKIAGRTGLCTFLHVGRRHTTSSEVPRCRDLNGNTPPPSRLDDGRTTECRINEKWIVLHSTVLGSQQTQLSSAPSARVPLQVHTCMDMYARVKPAQRAAAAPSTQPLPPLLPRLLQPAMSLLIADSYSYR